MSIPLTAAETPLPSTTYDILSDKNNLLWIATSSGVYHYNGYEFIHYTSADGLGDNEVLRLYEDKKGRIWFQSVNGNPSFYFNGRIFNASNNELLSKLEFNKMILSECEDDSGNLYIGSRESVYYKIDEHDEVTKLTFKGEENFMWPGGNTVHFVTQRMHKDFKPVRGDVYNDLVLFGVSREVYEVFEDTMYRMVLEMPENSREIIFLKIKNENEIFIGTRNGLFIWNRTGTKPLRHILKGVSVSSVEFDFENNLWVSTLESGVMMIPSLDVNIYSKQNRLPEDNITCIEKDDSGNLWIGMAKDHYAILHPDGFVDTGRLMKQSTLNITNIRHFNHSTYIISKSSISKITAGSIKELNSYGNDLLIHENGNCFLGQDNTLLLNKDQFENHLEEIVYNLTFRRSDYELLNARTNVIKQDAAGNVWLGTSKGLYRYDGTLLSYGTVHPLFHSPVRDITFDKTNDIMYVATLNGLLVVKNSRLHTVLDKQADMPNSECNALYIDHDNNLWAAFGNELMRLSYKNGTYQKMNCTDALKIECSRIVDIDMLKDVVYLATETGLVYFQYTDDIKNQVVPILWFSDFMVNDLSQQMNAPARFNYNENDISISYSAVSYLSKSQIIYSYFLEGYDGEWHRTAERTMHYRSLSPGTYTFQIHAENKSGLVSPVQSVTFTILPPFWDRVWFRLLVVLLITAGIALIWRIRIRSVRKAYEQENKTILLEKEKIEIEKRLSELEQQAFRQQMNPHFIFNALNTIKGYYAENDIKKASDYISKFSKLLRIILENTQHMIPLEQEIDALKLYLDLAGMRYENKFSSRFEVAPDVDTGETGIPPMLLQPFIENSIIHGFAPKAGRGSIGISFCKKGNQLFCEITDDGVGRNASQVRSKNSEHISKATTIISEYLSALNSKEKSGAFTIDIVDLFDELQNPAGTRVIIRMPFIKIW